MMRARSDPALGNESATYVCTLFGRLTSVPAIPATTSRREGMGLGFASGYLILGLSERWLGGLCLFIGLAAPRCLFVSSFSPALVSGTRLTQPSSPLISSALVVTPVIIIHSL